MNRLFSELKETHLENQRGGSGPVIRKMVFTEEDTCGKAKMCVLQTIPPGSSVGVHSHDTDAEFFYVVSGTLRVTDNGTEKDLVAGDCNFSGGGSSHGVKNVSDKDAVTLCVFFK
jgi:quercetin dioxygenase-like cupin family protein